MFTRQERGLNIFGHVSDRFSDSLSRFANHLSYQIEHFSGEVLFCRRAALMFWEVLNVHFPHVHFRTRGPFLKNKKGYEGHPPLLKIKVVMSKVVFSAITGYLSACLLGVKGPLHVLLRHSGVAT